MEPHLLLAPRLNASLESPAQDRTAVGPIPVLSRSEPVRIKPEVIITSSFLPCVQQCAPWKEHPPQWDKKTAQQFLSTE